MLDKKKSGDESFDIAVQRLLVRLDIKHQLRYAFFDKKKSDDKSYDIGVQLLLVMALRRAW